MPFVAGLVSVLSVRISASTTPKTQLTTIVRIGDLELPTASKATYVDFSLSLGPHLKKGPNVSSRYISHAAKRQTDTRLCSRTYSATAPENVDIIDSLSVHWLLVEVG
ncbi:uncharacterized protein LAJ45_09001 [Morchella importuna]|uniref:uncharacterized protein n=1 Tax=Morchella importuna TaxID=1174673 RepID=UPI001E8CE485|nr:uncharacterized protein LAJ45_09001 [Morchella importuna]KAH8146921.1 hypothetical protein LAJ45_09001 [Morchella importuna]